MNIRQYFRWVAILAARYAHGAALISVVREFLPQPVKRTIKRALNAIGVTPTSSRARPFISLNQVVTDLREIGVRPGDRLVVAVSFRNVGRIDGGPDALIEALLDAVGRNGTLVILTYNDIYPLGELDPANPAHIFDPLVTKCFTGIVPERMRIRADAVRSRHPSNSITAIGADALRLTRNHDETAGAYSPFTTLAELGGRFLGIGMEDRLVGLRHEAQAKAGILEILPCSHGILYRDARGELQTFVGHHVGACIKRLPELVAPMRAQGIVRDGSIGHAKALLFDVGPALEYMTMVLRANPVANLCYSPRCTWCAALARKLALKRA